ncbi:ATP-binding protein [Streptomyces sp. NPDC055078]
MSEACTGGTLVSRWTYSPRCVGKGRERLRKSLADWGLTGLEDEALIVLSELLTNAVRHAYVPGRKIETRWLRMPGGGLRIEVHDTAGGRPVLTEPTADAPGGRGLPLVAALAQRWGVAEREGPGKAVWAELSATATAGERRGP